MFHKALIWRDTDEMSLKSSETADGRVIGREEWLPTSRCTYVAQVVNQPLTIYTGIDTAIIFLQRDQTVCFMAEGSRPACTGDSGTKVHPLMYIPGYV